MTITGLLRIQHSGFGRILEEMGESLKDFEGCAGEELERSLLKLLPALRVHERIEHELLFPAFIKHVASVDPGILDLFKGTHKEIHEKVDALQEVLKDKGALLSRMVTAADFISLAKEHFEQEEQTLFPLFEKGVPEDIQKELGRRASEYAHSRSERKHIGGPT